MIQEDKPKKGETGYVDGTVFYAYTRLAVLLRKPVGQLTENDITNNPVLVQRAINDALTYRRVTKMGDYALSYADDTGNKVYLWCLKANANHGGPDLGLLYVPNGKTPADGVWIAGCVLAGGMNTYFVSLDTRTNEFTKFVWYNLGPDPNNANRYIRYVYTYDVATNVLTIVKEEGPTRGGQPLPPDKTEKERNPAAPPAEFKDLKLNGVQISLLDGDSAIPARPVVLAALDATSRMILTLTNPPLTGSGTETDPYIGIDANIEPGDTLVVTMPDNTIPVASGSNPDWILLTPNEPTTLFQYNGSAPTTIGVGDIIAGRSHGDPRPAHLVQPAHLRPAHLDGHQPTTVHPADPHHRLSPDKPVTRPADTNPLPPIAWSFSNRSWREPRGGWAAGRWWGLADAGASGVLHRADKDGVPVLRLHVSIAISKRWRRHTALDG